jgi:hypothetical protein
MPNINNDSELRQFIDSLGFEQQRALGVKFAESVMDLTQDPRLKKALDTSLTPAVTAPEVEEAYKTAKAISTATFTACGRDADWMAQAEHFTAAALQAALAPADQLPGKGTAAWKAAMQARMARNCAMIETGQGSADSESQRQYRIAQAASG